MIIVIYHPRELKNDYSNHFFVFCGSDKKPWVTKAISKEKGLDTQTSPDKMEVHQNGPHVIASFLAHTLGTPNVSNSGVTGLQRAESHGTNSPSAFV